jgi:DNA-binding SARP family transcriptional activator
MVQIHVSRLRKVLPAGLLVTRSPGYAVEISPEALDLVRFERLHARGRAELASGSAARATRFLQQALAQWQGPALAEFDEPFAAIESARLEELRLACIEDRIDADLTLGHHGALVAELDALAGRHPLRERIRRQHVLALYRSGRQADALAAYRQLRRTLATELGIEPSSALRELELRMLQQDPALDLDATEPRQHRRAPTPRSFRHATTRLAMRRRCALALPSR